MNAVFEEITRSESRRSRSHFEVEEEKKRRVDVGSFSVSSRREAYI